MIFFPVLVNSPKIIIVVVVVLVYSSCSGFFWSTVLWLYNLYG